MTEVGHFEEIVHRLEAPVFGFLFRLVHDEPLAEQLTELAFLRLHRFGRDCNDEEQCLTTIYRLAIQFVLQRGEGSSVPQRSRWLTTSDKEAAIRLAIEGLPNRERFAVLLHKYQALDLALIGKILDLNETEVKKLLLGAYRSLKISLGRYVDIEKGRN